MNQIEFVKAFKSTTHNAVDIAYDSQRIKALYYQTHSNTQVTQKLAIYGFYKSICILITVIRS